MEVLFVIPGCKGFCFRDAYENHAAVKLLIDHDAGNIIDVNKSAVGYYRWPEEQLRKMKIWDINTLPPDDVKKEMEKERDKLIVELKEALSRVAEFGHSICPQCLKTLYPEYSNDK